MSHALPWRPSGSRPAVRPGRSRVAMRPIGVSIRPGTTTFTRTRRRRPSNAACRHKPASAAFDESYAGIRLPGCSDATDDTSTTAPSSSRCCKASLQPRKWARALSANVRSHAAAVVPDSHAGPPMPTFTSTPSRPPSTATAASKSATIEDSSVASTVNAHAAPPSARICDAVSSARSRWRSAHATVAPSAAMRSDAARPLPSVTSSGGRPYVSCPAPMTSTLRPAMRPATC